MKKLIFQKIKWILRYIKHVISIPRAPRPYTYLQQVPGFVTVIITRDHVSTYINEDENRIKTITGAATRTFKRTDSKESASTRTPVRFTSFHSLHWESSGCSDGIGEEEEQIHPGGHNSAHTGLNGPLLSPLSKQVSETHSFAIHPVVFFSRHRREGKIHASDERTTARKYAISVPKYNRIAEQSYL